MSFREEIRRVVTGIEPVIPVRTAVRKWHAAMDAICPGLIETAMTQPMMANKEFLAGAIRRAAAGRVGTPDDFAGIAAFLA